MIFSLFLVTIPPKIICSKLNSLYYKALFTLAIWDIWILDNFPRTSRNVEWLAGRLEAEIIIVERLTQGDSWLVRREGEWDLHMYFIS
jgi:hypothetical protein